MEKEHRLAVRPGFRRAVAEHTGPFPAELVARLQDIVDLIAQMMNAAVRVALEEPCNRRIRAEWLQELDLGVGKRDEHRGNAVFRLWHRSRDLGAERLAIHAGSRRDVAHRNGNVIEPSDHACLRARQASVSPSPPMERSEMR